MEVIREVMSLYGVEFENMFRIKEGENKRYDYLCLRVQNKSDNKK